MEKKQVKVPEVVAPHNLSKGGKVAVGIVGIALTAGLGYGLFRLIKHGRAKRAAKKASEPTK